MEKGILYRMDDIFTCDDMKGLMDRQKGWCHLYLTAPSSGKGIYLSGPLGGSSGQYDISKESHGRFLSVINANSASQFGSLDSLDGFLDDSICLDGKRQFFKDIEVADADMSVIKKRVMFVDEYLVRRFTFDMPVGLDALMYGRTMDALRHDFYVARIESSDSIMGRIFRAYDRSQTEHIPPASGLRQG